jgi:hypothetical protein
MDFHSTKVYLMNVPKQQHFSENAFQNPFNPIDE